MHSHIICLEDHRFLASDSPFFVFLSFNNDQRMVAKEDTKERSRLSVFTQRICDVKCVYDVPSTAFVPPPKVVGTFVTLVPREKPMFEGGEKGSNHSQEDQLIASLLIPIILSEQRGPGGGPADCLQHAAEDDQKQLQVGILSL